MNAILTADGKIALPEELRHDAHLSPGDKLEVQFYKGTIVLRKHEPLSPEQCRTLLEQSRSQTKPQDSDALVVDEVIREVRSNRR